MKWYFKCKMVINKLVLSVATIMGFVFFTGADLIGAKGIHKYEEVNYFIENFYTESLFNFHNIFFGALALLGALIMLFGWKSFDRVDRDGIWLENMGICVLSVSFVGYGLVTQLALHIMSWCVIFAYILSALLMILFVINIIYFAKNKQIRSEQSNMKKVVLAAIVAIVITAVGGIYYAEGLRDNWDEQYEKYCEAYENEVWGLLRNDEHTLQYTRLQFVNHFNPDGKSFTYEELEESITNFKAGTGSWYTLWYCIEYLNNEFSWVSDQVSFGDYDYSSNPIKGYWVYVCRYLVLKDVDVYAASDEQLDEACLYVYECITNQVPIELIGEDGEELVFEITIPSGGSTDDVSVRVDSDKYYPSTMLWFEAAYAGDEARDSEPVDEIKEGTLYKVRLESYCGMPYAFSKDAKVIVNGVDYEMFEVEVEYDNLTVYLWLIL